MTDSVLRPGQHQNHEKHWERERYDFTSHNNYYPAFTDGGSGLRRSAPQSRAATTTLYQGGESFNDVIQVELEFLHRHAKKARLDVSFDPADQPSYVTKRAIAAHRSPNTLKHNIITKIAYFFMDNSG